MTKVLTAAVALHFHHNLMQIYSQFPSDKTITQQVIRNNGIKPVISADLRKIYGLSIVADVGAFGTNPDFSELDKQLDQATGLDVHIHPIVCRYPELKGRDSLTLKGHVNNLARPIVDHCVSRGLRKITLAGELTLCGDTDLWAEIIAFYKAIHADYPELELWISSHRIRQQSDRDSILTRLEDLQGIASGFIGADYISLYQAKPEIPEQVGPVQWMKISAMGSVSLMRLSYLPPFWRELQSAGLKVALETSALSTVDLPIVRKAQIQIYREISAKCEHHGADLWLWNACEQSSRDHQGNHSYSGVWDEAGNMRLSI